VTYYNDRGNISYCYDFEKVISFSALMDDLGLSPDFSKVPKTILDRAIFIGNETHDCIEHGRTAHADDDVLGCLLSYSKWNTKRVMETVSDEQTTCYDFGAKQYLVGRVYRVAFLDGEHIALDWKTSSKVYDTAMLQIAFYKIAFNCGEGTIVHLHKDGTEATEYHSTQEWETKIDALVDLYYCNEKDKKKIAQQIVYPTVKIKNNLLKQYLKVEQELKDKKASLESIRKEIIESLKGQKGVSSSDGKKLTFTMSKDSEKVSYDTGKMQADGVDIEQYRSVKQVKGSYKVTISKEKNDE